MTFPLYGFCLLTGDKEVTRFSPHLGESITQNMKQELGGSGSSISP